MTQRDAIEARIARRLTANWTAIRHAKVTPLQVAQDIVSALEVTRSLAAPDRATPESEHEPYACCRDHYVLTPVPKARASAPESSE